MPARSGDQGRSRDGRSAIALLKPAGLPRLNNCLAEQEFAVGVRVGWPAARSGRRKPALQHLDDCCGDVVLNLEDVLQFAVIGRGPEMITVVGADQLHRHPNGVAGFADAAFKHVRDPERLRDLGDRDLFTLEVERGGAGRHSQVGASGDEVDEFLGNPVRKVLLVLLLAHIDERQDRDRLLAHWPRGSPRCRCKRRCAESIDQDVADAEKDRGTHHQHAGTQPRRCPRHCPPRCPRRCPHRCARFDCVELGRAPRSLRRPLAKRRSSRFCFKQRVWHGCLRHGCLRQGCLRRGCLRHGRREQTSHSFDEGRRGLPVRQTRPLNFPELLGHSRIPLARAIDDDRQ